MQRVPHRRNVLEPLQQKARQSVMVICLGQIEIELSLELEDLQISCHQPGAGRKVVVLFGQIPLLLQASQEFCFPIVSLARHINDELKPKIKSN